MTSSEAVQDRVDYPPREERRPAALNGWLVRKEGDEAHDFLIDNLSYGGCRIQTSAPLARGDDLRLTVHRRGAIPATVRWRNGHGTGLSFAPDLDPPPHKPRKEVRLPLSADLLVRRAGRRSQLLGVSNLSRQGCCLDFDEPPVKGEWIWVAMPGLAPLQARVLWAENRRAGVEFVHPIHSAVFNLLLLRWGIGA